MFLSYNMVYRYIPLYSVVIRYAVLKSGVMYMNKLDDSTKDVPIS